MHILPPLFSLAALTLAIPLPASPAPRSPPCQNAPNTIPASPTPRSNPHPIYWCLPSTSTYITLLAPLPPPQIPGPPALHDMIDEAYSYIIGHLALEGDSLIAGGAFAWRAHDFVLRTWNANNHQTTWGVLRAAVGTLMDYMETCGYGAVSFSIYDGGNQVGAGVVE